jgi:poly(3-hydroxybutyrate) depolymerase
MPAAPSKPHWQSASFNAHERKLNETQITSCSQQQCVPCLAPAAATCHPASPERQGPEAAPKAPSRMRLNQRAADPARRSSRCQGLSASAAPSPMDSTSHARRWPTCWPNFKMPQLRHAAARPPTNRPRLPGTFSDGSYSNAAGTRSYKLYVPASYRGEPTALVVMLHGCTQDPDDFATGTQMNVLAEEMRCLVVYPANRSRPILRAAGTGSTTVDQQRGQGEPSIIAGITAKSWPATASTRHRCMWPACRPAARWLPSWARCTRNCIRPSACTRACRLHRPRPAVGAGGHERQLGSAQNKPGGRSRSSSSTATRTHRAPDQWRRADGAGARRRRGHGVSSRAGAGWARLHTRTVHKRDDGKVHAEQWLIHGAGHAWSGGSARQLYRWQGPGCQPRDDAFFQDQALIAATGGARSTTSCRARQRPASG